MNTKKLNEKKTSRGGARSRCGRKRITDPAEWQYITCLLKRETVQALREVGGQFYGRYLQAHLEKYPIETHAITKSKQSPPNAVKKVRAAAPGISAREFVMRNMWSNSHGSASQKRAPRSTVE